MAALQPTAPQLFGSGAGSSGEPASDTHTGVVVDSGSNRVLVVLIEGEGTSTGGAVQVNSMTYGGASMTKLDRQAAATWPWAEIWYLIAPTVGTADIVVTLNAGDNWNLCALVVQGANQTTPLRTAAKAAGTGTSASATVGSVGASDLVLAILGLDGTAHNPTPGTNETERMERDSLTGGTEGAVYTQAGSDGGAVTPAWTTSTIYALVATAAIDAGGGGATVTDVAAVGAGSAPAPAVSGGATVAVPVAVAGGDAAIVVATASAGADTFEEPDGQLDTPWAAFGGLALPFLVGGEVFAAADLTIDGAAYIVSLPADQQVEIEFASAPTTNTNLTFDVYVRISALSSGADYYAFRMYSTGWRLLKRTGGGALTIIAQVNPRPQTLNTITGLRLVIVGTTLTGFALVSGVWTQVITFTDSSSPITAGGFVGFGTQLAAAGANPIGVEVARWASAGAVDATVVVPAAVAAGDGPVPGVNAGATVVAPAAAAAGVAPPFNNIISVVIGAPAATSEGDAPVPSVGSVIGATVTAPPAVASGAAPVPAVAGGASSTAPAAVAAGDGPVPGVVAGAVVAAPVAVARGVGNRPTDIDPDPAGGGDTSTLTTTFAD